MATRMKHKNHGFTHVYSDAEEKALNKNGWIRDEVEKPNVSFEDEAPKAKPKRKPRSYK